MARRVTLGDMGATKLKKYLERRKTVAVGDCVIELEGLGVYRCEHLHGGVQSELGTDDFKAMMKWLSDHGVDLDSLVVVSTGGSEEQPEDVEDEVVATTTKKGKKGKSSKVKATVGSDNGKVKKGKKKLDKASGGSAGGVAITRNVKGELVKLTYLKASGKVKSGKGTFGNLTGAAKALFPKQCKADKYFAANFSKKAGWTTESGQKLSELT